MYMNEYFMTFHRHSLAPLKILKQEISGKELNDDEKKLFAALFDQARKNYNRDSQIMQMYYGRNKQMRTAKRCSMMNIIYIHTLLKRERKNLNFVREL
jgi:hypothetical protein